MHAWAAYDIPHSTEPVAPWAMSAPTRDDPAAVLIGKDASRVDLVSRLRTVSSVHARIARGGDGDGFTIEDLGSTNGTFVDGERLPPGLLRPIAFGARVTLGKLNGFVFGPSHVEKLTSPDDFEAPQSLEIGSVGAAPTIAEKPPESSERRTMAIPSAPLTTPPLRLSPDDGDESDEFASVGDTNVSRPSTVRVADGAGLVKADPVPPGSPTLTIGYDASNDVVVPNAVVSGRHARIGFDGRRFVLEDQGSTNGTWFGGDRIERAELQVGDSFAVGGVRILFDASLEARLRERAAGRVADGSSSSFAVGRRIGVEGFDLRDRDPVT